jgi:dihydroorotate dehydrogenase
MKADMSSMLELPSCWMNQAGTLGYSPMLSEPVPGSVFVTNPVSYRPRTPTADRDVISYPGGFLLHTGLANPGWRSVRTKFANHWMQYRLPVWIHVISQDPDELEKIVRDCEETEGVAAVELGLPLGCPRDILLQMIRHANGEIPLVVHLSAGDNLSVLNYLPPEVSAVTLGTPRGRMKSAERKVISGRLHGPGLFPLMLEQLYALRGLEIPLVLGGICNKDDGETALQAGAAAVQMDRLCWMGELPGSPAS